MTTRRFKLAILDWNGTIMNDIQLSYRSTLALLIKFAPNHPVRPTFSQFCNQMTLKYMEFYWFYGFPKDKSKDVLVTERNSFFTKNMNETFLNNGVIEFLTCCNKMGIKIAIVSGEDSPTLENGVDRFIRPKVNVDYVRGSVHGKESVFQEVLKLYNCTSEGAFHVGDSAGDQVAANNAGLFSIALWYDGSYTTEEKLLATKPKLVISSFHEARKVLSMRKK